MPATEQAPPASRMSTRRLLIAYVAIVVVVGGHLRVIAVDRERWPFSPYPMYSNLLGDRFSAFHLSGVVDGAGGREIPLVAGRYLRPLDFVTLRNSLARMDAQRNRAALLDEAMGDCLARYESRRRSGAHDGPPLRAMRLYRLSWVIDPLARNKDRPDREELLHEVARRENR